MFLVSGAAAADAAVLSFGCKVDQHHRPAHRIARHERGWPRLYFRKLATRRQTPGRRSIRPRHARPSERDVGDVQRCIVVHRGRQLADPASGAAGAVNGTVVAAFAYSAGDFGGTRIAEMIVQSGAPTAAGRQRQLPSSTATGSPSHGAAPRTRRCAVCVRLLRGSRPRCGRQLAPADERVIHGDSHFSAEERAAFERTLGMGGVHARGRSALRALGPHRHDVHGSAASAALPRVGEPETGNMGGRTGELIWWVPDTCTDLPACAMHGWVTCSAFAARAVRWAGHERAQPVARIRRRGLPRMRARRRLPRSPRRLHHGHRDGGPNMPNPSLGTRRERRQRHPSFAAGRRPISPARRAGMGPSRRFDGRVTELEAMAVVTNKAGEHRARPTRRRSFLRVWTRSLRILVCERSSGRSSLRSAGWLANTDRIKGAAMKTLIPLTVGIFGWGCLVGACSRECHLPPRRPPPRHTAPLCSAAWMTPRRSPRARRVALALTRSGRSSRRSRRTVASEGRARHRP